MNAAHAQIVSYPYSRLERKTAPDLKPRTWGHAPLRIRIDGRETYFVEASQTTWLIAAAPGSFLITGEVPPLIRTFTVRV